MTNRDKWPELLEKHSVRLKTEIRDGKRRVMSQHYFCEKCGKSFEPGVHQAAPDECPGRSEDIF